MPTNEHSGQSSGDSDGREPSTRSAGPRAERGSRRPATAIPLTRRQRDILDFFESYTREHGISPTLEEIASSLGVNKVTVFGHVAEMERKGALVRVAKKGVSRALQVSEPRHSEVDARTGVDASPLQILGTIAAGVPVEALEEPETLDLRDITPPGADCYALRVRGDSMIEDGIHEGDLVLVERRAHAHNGEIVVAILPDETATLKRFYREGNRVRLQPANAQLQPRIVDSVEIRGVVLGVLRQYT
jgi:repressor LexA